MSSRKIIVEVNKDLLSFLTDSVIVKGSKMTWAEMTEMSQNLGPI